MVSLSQKESNDLQIYYALVVVNVLETTDSVFYC